MIILETKRAILIGHVDIKGPLTINLFPKSDAPWDQYHTSSLKSYEEKHIFHCMNSWHLKVDFGQQKPYEATFISNHTAI